MNWDRIEASYRKCNSHVIEQWNGLRGQQFGSSMLETYAISDEETEYELTEWQQHLSEIEHAAHQGR